MFLLALFYFPPLFSALSLFYYRVFKRRFHPPFSEGFLFPRLILTLLAFVVSDFQLKGCFPSSEWWWWFRGRPGREGRGLKRERKCKRRGLEKGREMDVAVEGFEVSGGRLERV